jgi:hypothetical protein
VLAQPCCYCTAAYRCAAPPPAAAATSRRLAPPYDLSLTPAPESVATVAITKHAAELPISLHSSPPDSNPPPWGSQMHNEASTPLHGVNPSRQLHPLSSPELPDHHRLPHCLNSLPRCLPAVEIAVDDFVVASSSRSAARRRLSSARAPSRLDSSEDAAGEHPCTATGEDDSFYPARSKTDDPDRPAHSAPSLQPGCATSPVKRHLGKVNFQSSRWQ